MLTQMFRSRIEFSSTKNERKQSSGIDPQSYPMLARTPPPLASRSAARLRLRFLLAPRASRGRFLCSRAPHHLPFAVDPAPPRLLRAFALRNGSSQSFAAHWSFESAQDGGSASLAFNE